MMLLVGIVPGSPNSFTCGRLDLIATLPAAESDVEPCVPYVQLLTLCLFFLAERRALLV